MGNTKHINIAALPLIGGTTRKSNMVCWIMLDFCSIDRSFSHDLRSSFILMAISGTKNWRYLPKAYFSGLNFREYPQKIWPNIWY
jgi:hypothetical protein